MSYLLETVRAIFTQDRPKTIENKHPEKKLAYTYGKLTNSGLRQYQAIRQEVIDFLKTELGYDLPTGTVPGGTRIQLRQADGIARLLFAKGIEILMADYSQEMTPRTIVDFDEIDPDFVNAIYDEVIRLNPSLDEERAAKLAELGRAQEQTRKPDGAAISPEEADFLASSTPSAT